MDASSAGKTGWDFFLSYTAADLAWAEWIAWELEAAGYRVLFQGWDFVPGSHWMTRMQQGAAHAERTLAIVSRAYLKSVYGQQEWEAAYRADPGGFTRKLVPIRVEDCDRPGLLGGVVSFDLFGCSREVARRRLLSKVAESVAGRAKPESAPDFPGQPPAPAPQLPGWAPPHNPPAFPGGAGAGSPPGGPAPPGGRPQLTGDAKFSAAPAARPSPGWDLTRADRGNGEDAVVFHAHRRTYWVLVAVLALVLLVVVMAVMTTSSSSVPSRIAVAAVVGAVVLFFIYGFARMARSPVRLEVGAEGVQLFARSGATWLPWRVIDRIDVVRVQGIPHVVAWLPEPGMFPAYDTLGGGPRQVPEFGAVAVCSVGVMRASARDILRALHTYGSGKVGRAAL